MEEVEGKSFEEFITLKISSLSNYSRYSQIFDRIVSIILQWKIRFSHNSIVWKRFIKGGLKRLLKEVNESIPVIERVLTHITLLSENCKVTIFDLCSGFGFLSMFLSELLPPEKVHRIILIDKQWSREAINQKKDINSNQSSILELEENNNNVDNNKNNVVDNNEIKIHINIDTNIETNNDTNNDDGDDDAIEDNHENEENENNNNDNNNNNNTNKYISIDHLIGKISSSFCFFLFLCCYYYCDYTY